MSSSNLIGEWSSGYWQAIGSPSYVSALAISGYACTSSTLGQLNTFIGTCYNGSGFTGAPSFNYDVTPDITAQELALVGGLYAASYWDNLAQSTMGYGGDSIPWLAVAEGDTRATRVNAASIGATYMDRATQAQKDLRYMVNVYITQVAGGDTPRDVEYYTIWPATWSNSYIGGN